jgi:hypothetical protein
MADYLLIRDLHIDNAQALQCEGIIGVPALTQYVGFLDMLKQNLNKTGINVSFKRFAVAYHNVYVQAPMKYGIYRGVMKPYTAISFLNDKYVARTQATEDWRIDVDVSLLIELDDCVVAKQDMRIALSYILNNSNYFGGGLLSKLTNFNFNKHISIIVNNHHERDADIKRALSPGWVVKSRMDLIKNSDDPLRAQVEHHLASTTNKRLSALVTGYKTIGEIFDIKNSRDCSNKSRYFAEAVSTLVEWKKPYDCRHVEDFLWTYNVKELADKDNVNHIYFICEN